MRVQEVKKEGCDNKEVGALGRKAMQNSLLGPAWSVTAERIGDSATLVLNHLLQPLPLQPLSQSHR